MRRKNKVFNNLDGTLDLSPFQSPKSPMLEVIFGHQTSKAKAKKRRKAQKESSRRNIVLETFLDDEVKRSTEYALGNINTNDYSINVAQNNNRTQERHTDADMSKYIAEGVWSISNDKNNMQISDDENENEIEVVNEISFDENETTIITQQQYDPLDLFEEIDHSQFITSLQDAIKQTEMTEYKCTHDDLSYHQSLLESDNIIFRISDNVLLFCQYNGKNKQLSENHFLICDKRDETWVCDNDCPVYYANKFSNEADKTPLCLCIHGVFAELIINHNNPTKLEVVDKSKITLICEEPEILFFKRCADSQVEWLFFMDHLNTRRLLWLNRKGDIKCKSHYNIRGCPHTHLLKEALKQFLGEREFEIITGQGVYKRIIETGNSSFKNELLYSEEEIPVPRTLLTKLDEKQNTKKWKEYYEYKIPCNLPTELFPQIKKCNYCHTVVDKMETIEHKAKYFDEHLSGEVTLYSRMCTCKEVYHLDGCMQHLLNYHDSIIMTHELWIKMFTYMTTGRSKSFSCFRNELMSTYINRGYNVEIGVGMLISIFKAVYFKFAFFKRLGCMLCDPSGNNRYKVIHVDGTDLILASQYAENIYTPITTKESHTSTVAIQYLKSTRFIQDVSARKLLERKFFDVFGSRKVDGKWDKLKGFEVIRLNTFLNKDNNKEIREFLEWATEIKEDKSKEELSSLLYPILRHSFRSNNIMQLSHPMLIDKLTKFDEIVWKNDEALFGDKCMGLKDLINKLIEQYGSFQSLPREFVCFMKKVGERGSVIRSDYKKNRYKDGNVRITDLAASEENKIRMRNCTTSGADYSGDLLYYRPNYSIDGKRNYKEQTKCKKSYNKREHMTSAFLIGVCPHVCPIFDCICKKAESVDHVSSSIMCTMPTAPDFLFYDNPCKEQDSCLLREYEYWEKCVFISDQLHIPGHKCGYLYSCKPYKYGHDLLARINDSGSEQINNLLLTVRLSGSFMALDTLMIVVKANLEAQRRKVYQKYASAIVESKSEFD
eukprot:506850_1